MPLFGSLMKQKKEWLKKKVLGWSVPQETIEYLSLATPLYQHLIYLKNNEVS